VRKGVSEKVVLSFLGQLVKQVKGVGKSVTEWLCCWLQGELVCLWGVREGLGCQVRSDAGVREYYAAVQWEGVRVRAGRAGLHVPCLTMRNGSRGHGLL